MWQETVTFPLLQCPKLIALPSQQGFVSAAPKAHFRIGTWVAQRTKLCPLSSSQDSTILLYFSLECGLKFIFMESRA